MGNPKNDMDENFFGTPMDWKPPYDHRNIQRLMMVMSWEC